MREMEERVARALCDAIGIPPDGLVAENRYKLDDLQIAWKTQLPKARAALAAMRELTPEMLRALIVIGSTGDMLGAWRAAIDAALAEKEPPK